MIQPLQCVKSGVRFRVATSSSAKLRCRQPHPDQTRSSVSYAVIEVR